MCKHNTYSYLWLSGNLQAVDQCISLLILQLNLTGIKTIDSCCGHGKGYPNVICEEGTEEKLREFGCKIVIVRKDKKVVAYFPVNSWTGKVHPVCHEND
ncbi:MAG: hypothetical protein KAU46_01765 [Candidatus Aminicenantes bacterium]|nr:hypothetical protein [Candidatus Aminicenantes bacterium]